MPNYIPRAMKKNVTEFYLQFNILYVLHRQSGDMFVVKVKPVLIKGVRIIVEHMIETLPDRKVRMNWKHMLCIILLYRLLGC